VQKLKVNFPSFQGSSGCFLAKDAILQVSICSIHLPLQLSICLYFLVRLYLLVFILSLACTNGRLFKIYFMDSYLKFVACACCVCSSSAVDHMLAWRESVSRRVYNEQTEIGLQLYKFWGA